MQEPDDKDGAYYVSAVGDGKTALLFGPFINNHKAALDAVEKVRKASCEIDVKAVFYSFGTVRLYGRDTYPMGALNNIKQLK